MNILVVAGEASGDLHAANLVTALREARPGLTCFGVGGERLRAAGLECLARSEELSVMGLAEVVRELPRLVTLARRVRREAIRRGPDLAVLVDAPDFNLPLARHLRRAGIPVVVYISPQLWAWRSGRVRRIRRDVVRVLCILPFEVEFYARHGVAAEYVGHPLVDELSPLMAAPPPRDDNSLALLPGSRWHEVSLLLPGMVAAAEALAATRPGLAVRILVAPGLARDRLAALVGSPAVQVELVSAERHRVLASSRAALVASGTATLECALLGVPMVVGYRLHRLTFAIARRLVRVPHVSLVNLVAGREVVPELVQEHFTPEELARRAGALWGPAGDDQRQALHEVRRWLGDPGASRRAAAAVVRVLEEAR